MTKPMHEKITNILYMRYWAVVIGHIADEELYLRIGQGDTLFFLLFLVPREDADLTDVGIQKPAQNSIAKR